MASDVDICNLALANLGDAATLSSIDPPEGSAQADHCATFYPIARDTILEDHAWSFATRRIALAEVTPEHDAWEYAYYKPSEALRILNIFDSEITDETAISTNVVKQNFIIERDSSGDEVILTNVADAWCRYIVRVTDTSKFSMMLVNGIAAYLSSMLAGPMVKGSEGLRLQDYWMKIAQMYINKAKALDGNSQRLQVPYTPAGIRARQ